MPSTFTTNLNVEKPATGEQVDTWGGTVNDNMDIFDAVFTADGSGTSVGLKVGAAKTLNATAGTLLLPAVNTPAQTADGSVAWDADSDLLTVGTGAARKTMVDTDSTQTLTNKTLTSPVLSSPTINGGIDTLGITGSLGIALSATGALNIGGVPGSGATGNLCIGFASAGTPETDPLYGFGQLYMHSDGSLRYRSPNGTTTTIGAA
jgi:hypothetical protein